MNKLSKDRQALVLSQLVEGNSIRSIERVTGIHRDTIMRLLVSSGERAQHVLDEKMQAVKCRFVQVDEIWCYCGKKQARLTEREKLEGSEYGDRYVFVAIDAETKLVPLHLVGKRNERCTHQFMRDLNSRIKAERFQLTTDGFGPYRNAVYLAFDNVDFAQIIKNYGEEVIAEKRYSPAKLVSITIRPEIGNPDPRFISTSYVERQNLTMRMGMRRFTRLTNAFSKKLDNLVAACSLHFYHYNFMRIHRTLRCTPAMAAGIERTLGTWEPLLS